MITGVILTHNEESNIVACVEHLRPYVDEVILVDTESTDRTVELARPLVDRVLTHPHVPNFDAARNIAIPVAQHDWLWFVDADEHVPEATGQLVNCWIRERGGEFEAINIPFKSYFCGKWMQHCGWWPGYTCARVLKRGFFQFSATLHGGVELNGREVRAPANAQIGIEHFSFRDLHHWVEKCNRYTSTEALQLAQRGIVYDWRGALRFMVHDLWEHYEKFNARLDGERGWILTWCAALYRWLSVAKLVDHGRSSEQMGGPSSVPADLDEFVRAFEEELAAFRTDQPALPLGIVWRAPIWGDTQGANHARQVILELVRGPRHLVVEALPEKSTAQITDEARILLATLERCRRRRSVLTVTQWGQMIVPPDRCACHNILRLTASDRLPQETMPIVESYDELWLDADDQAHALREAGAAPERMLVLPQAAKARSVPSDQAARMAEGIERRFQEIDRQFESRRISAPRPGDLRVILEGEFFAGHSFSNINEQLARQFIREPGIACSLERVRRQVSRDHRALGSHDLSPYFGRDIGGPPELTIRHAFPPNWQRPPAGRWVHIQPWEFGHLPNDWVDALRHQVDETWVMSHYVEQVYLASGVDPHKIQYIPWGIDPEVFRPDVPARRLPTKKSFRFVYVGGTVLRKGFDRLLAAYLEEFTPDDDVCLVVKDVGTTTFYQPQSMRAEVFEAQRLPTNPEIVYLEQECTPGQLASMYVACHCLVAPYRGEGFGLPVLEALACGVPPIVPVGGPTDDFVDADTGYLLPSEVVAADGVTNVCGPATELHVSISDLRYAMRRAYLERDRTRTLGLAGSRRVRQEFTWDRTSRQMIDRLRAISGRDTTIPSQAAERAATVRIERSPNNQRLAALVCEAVDAKRLVASLSRIRPFVEAAFIHDLGRDPRVPALAREYDATLVVEGSEHEAVADWLLVLQAGEYVTEEDLRQLHPWLGNLPDDVDEVALLSVAGRTASDGELDGSRVFRIRESAESNRVGMLPHGFRDRRACRGGVKAPFTVHGAAGPRPGPTETAQRKSQPTYGKLKKSLLIQMASGPHLPLLQLTRIHHQRYAELHGLDYWCVGGNPAGDKRPGWGKVPLVLSGIAMGYETVIWLDADAVIVRPEINLAALVDHGIGMVRHPHPEHWNTGVMIVRADADVEGFWREIDAAPENNSAWMEQLAVNQHAERGGFAGLIRPLDLRFNSVPGFAMAPDPVVVAAHGMAFAERQSILADALAGVANRDNGQLIGRVDCRELFGDLLNSRGLLGEAVEVGVHRGEFASLLLERWRGRMLHLVDPWRHLPGYHDIGNLSDAEHEVCFRETRRQLAPFASRCRIHRALSVEAAVEFPDRSLDFVYLDANHSLTAVRQDLRLWFPKVRPGGVIAGHDFLDGELPEGDFGVATAVRDFEKEHQLTVHLTDDPPWRSWYMFIPNIDQKE